MTSDPEPFTDEADRRLLAQFVVWQLRTGDLPEKVRLAARRLARDTPAPDGWNARYQGNRFFRVTGFPRDQGPLLEVTSALPDVAVGELLAGPVDLQYLLVTPLV